jgi:hypothetical protein
MSKLLRFPSAVQRDSGVDAWFSKPDDELRRLAHPWFEQMRGCGPDVRELLHDGHPTACVEDAAFGYVNAFRAHVNVGFFYGAALDDPAQPSRRHRQAHAAREAPLGATSERRRTK